VCHRRTRGCPDERIDQADDSQRRERGLASAFAAANRLRCNDSAVIARLDAAFASEVPAQLGFGF
jgi:hypothetical protein